MNRIKELREERGLSQMALAIALGTTQTAIWRWESEKNELTKTNIIKLADYFGCTTDELLGREDVPASSNGLTITPIDKTLLAAFHKLPYEDQNKVVGMVQALTMLS